jgi:iron complex outermembrane receptor protein
MRIRKISVIFFLGASTLYFAQSSADTLSGETAVDEVTIIGTRNKKRTIINTPVPVDVIDVKQISQSTGQVDVNQLLQICCAFF